MIKAIKELGELKLKREGRNISDLLSILVQDPNKTGRYPFVFVIGFKREENRLSYKRILVGKYSKDKVERYLYRRGSSGKGPNYTPTCVTGGNFERTLKNRIEGWFKKIKTTNKGDLIFELKTEEKTIEVPLDSPIFRELFDAVITNKNKIFSDLINKWEKVQPSLKRENGTGVVLTIGILDHSGNNIDKYIGDFPSWQKFLTNIKMLKLQGIHKDRHLCSVCGTEGDAYGNAIADIFKFYTLDKPGYIAGGFQQLDAWKNFPLCLNCTLKIEEGKEYLDNYLQFSMGGNKYYLIPEFILGIEEAKEIIDDFFRITTYPRETLSNIKRISADEKEILEELGKLKDEITYNFMFFERQTGSPAVHRINLLVEGILPSRISTIFNAKSKAETSDIFKNLKVKKNKYEDVEFRFDAFRQFTPSRKAFLEVVDKTFRGVPFQQYLVFSWFMRKIRQRFVNEMYLKPLVLQAFVSFIFFKELGILPKSEHFRKGGHFMTELKEKTESFFANFAETFYTPAHKVVFLLGVLTQKLLNIQYQERSATPFRKCLRGLRMKEEDFKGLLPKIQDKLEQYGKNYYRSLETLISGYFCEAGKGWQITTDELNFYFILGMNLVDEVYKALGLKEKKED